MNEEVRDLANVVLAWEQRLVDNDLGLKTIDRLNSMRNTPDHLRHRGVSVAVTDTNDTGDDRGKDRYRVRDTMVIELAYRCNPMDQQLGRRTALSLEAQVRRLITDRQWEPTLHIKYVNSRRAVHPQSADWYLMTLTFTQTRHVKTE